MGNFISFNIFFCQWCYKMKINCQGPRKTYLKRRCKWLTWRSLDKTDLKPMRKWFICCLVRWIFGVRFDDFKIRKCRQPGSSHRRITITYRLRPISRRPVAREKSASIYDARLDGVAVAPEDDVDAHWRSFCASLCRSHCQSSHRSTFGRKSATFGLQRSCEALLNQLERYWICLFSQRSMLLTKKVSHQPA